MDLRVGDVAVVTGAASGIGRALVDGFAAVGMRVVLADVERDALHRAADEVSRGGVEALAVPTDVRREDAVQALAEATIGRFGSVHVVCNNAGVASHADPWTGPIEAWHWVMDVNFWGVVHGVRAFLPHLVSGGRGHIVNTASIAGLNPGGTGGAYSASKHATVAVCESLYTGLRASGVPIGISVLCPGWVRTSIMDAERNWPESMGDRPESAPTATALRRHMGQAITDGSPPGAMAEAVLDAIAEDRFWVIPHREFLELAVQRWQRIAQGLNPEMTEQVPGMPPTRQILAEQAAEAPTTSPLQRTSATRR